MKTMLSLSLFSSGLLSSSCNNDELDTTNSEENTETTYTLSQEHAGEMIIQLDATQQYGLVVAKVDQVTYADHSAWSDSKAVVETYPEGGADWQLPTKTESQLIYNNQSTFGLNGFDSRNYWNATLGSGSTWLQYFEIPQGVTSSHGSNYLIIPCVHKA